MLRSYQALSPWLKQTMIMHLLMEWAWLLIWFSRPLRRSSFYQYDFCQIAIWRHPESRWAWLKSRLEVNGIIAVLAGVLVYGAVHLLGMAANHEALTLFLCVLGSVTFMSMVTALTTWNNKVGAFISLILLLLQLASSAGTYPIELSPKFFRSSNHSYQCPTPYQVFVKLFQWQDRSQIKYVCYSFSYLFL